ncbi:hypothetical protein [Actinoallomurus bryophytorum]|uniref:hypothetical protein n=1 Tax=Actinoallomurus bryophytorum TaxID=1490222 RepID=UPI00163AC8BE|nr:hypothetical protein [Actinoallomurus bryophytorum]
MCFLAAVPAETLRGLAFAVATAGALGTRLVSRWISAGPGGACRARPNGYT